MCICMDIDPSVQPKQHLFILGVWREGWCSASLIGLFHHNWVNSHPPDKSWALFATRWSEPFAALQRDAATSCVLAQLHQAKTSHEFLLSVRSWALGETFYCLFPEVSPSLDWISCLQLLELKQKLLTSKTLFFFLFFWHPCPLSGKDSGEKAFHWLRTALDLIKPHKEAIRMI